MRRIVVHCEAEATKAAMLEDGLLTDYFVQKKESKQSVGHLFKGRVVNVLPGMQAAFVDIGQAKNAFLYVDDLLPAHLEKQPKVKPSIDQLVRVGEEILVQVTKEAFGTKGSRVTTHFTLPGRWLVYMPEADYVAVSRKIEGDEEKNRLKAIAEEMRQPGEGIIIRTVAAGEAPEALERDFEDLRGRWKRILERAAQCTAPCEIYRELDIIPRLIRDWYTDQVDELIIDDERIGAEIVALLRSTLPQLAERVRVRPAGDGLFHEYGISDQLERLFRPKVWLDNGGYLIIEATEALTVIDVNTGKYTGTHDLEDTVYATNMEAAEMIARLLRLWDIGGIIIVDFIDMSLDAHRERIFNRLEELFKEDRTKCIAVGWTKLGLFEITRKKVRDSQHPATVGTCPECRGSGRQVQ